jgi:integrase
MKRTPSLSSQRGEAVVLRQLFAQAAKWGYVGRGLIPLVQVPKVPPSPRPSFTIDEIDTLLKLSNERRYDPRVNDEVKRDRRVLHNYVDLAITTGMRPTELRNLDWADVLDYEASKSKKVRDRDIRFRTRGKGKSRVFIPLEWAINPIDDLYRLWKQDHGKEPASTDPVFANRAGKRITSMNKSLIALLEAADLRTDHLGKKRDSYSFRHFYISEQLRAGVDVFILARNTGTSPDMIDKFYGQVRVEQFKEALRPSWG